MTTTPTPTDLDALKALEQAATPAPWDEPRMVQPNMAGRHQWWIKAPGPAGLHATGRDEDVHLVVAMRNALPALLAELATARRELDDANLYGHEMAGKVVDLCRDMGVVQRERDAARKELAKTRAELETARLELATVTESADEATRQADGRRDEIDRLRAEQGTATTPRTYRDMPVYPCGKVGRGIVHMAHVYGVGKAEVACNGLLSHPVPLASPATTAEPADEPKATRCCPRHREPGEARYGCATAPGVTDPCCNDCHYWVAWNRQLDGDDVEPAAS